MDWRLYPYAIRALLMSDTMETDAPTEDWIEALNEVTNAYGPDAVIAWASAQGDSDSKATFGPDELFDEIKRVYRHEWESPAAFVEGQIVSDFCESGEENEGAGIRRFLETFAAHMNWTSAADDGDVTAGYTLITLDPENSRTVHAFELDT